MSPYELTRMWCHCLPLSMFFRARPSHATRQKYNPGRRSLTAALNPAGLPGIQGRPRIISGNAWNHHAGMFSLKEPQMIIKLSSSIVCTLAHNKIPQSHVSSCNTMMTCGKRAYGKSLRKRNGYLDEIPQLVVSCLCPELGLHFFRPFPLLAHA
jgi:hypothetical protein